MKPLGLGKRNKLCSATAIERLFSADDSCSAIAYPLRAVWNTASMRHDGQTGAKFLVSIPKKRLRHAVDRVTMRRRVREAYRLIRNSFSAGADMPVDIAFIYVANELRPYNTVERSMTRLLSAIYPSATTNESSESDQTGC